MKKLFLIYGIPGSGKSTIAEKIKNKYGVTHHYEADMFFYKNDEYCFNPKQLFLAHNWCHRKCEQVMKTGQDVIISNTSLTPLEREFYCSLSAVYGYRIYHHLCNGNYQNIHGVPQDKIELMKNKLQAFSYNEYDNSEELKLD